MELASDFYAFVHKSLSRQHLKVDLFLSHFYNLMIVTPNLIQKTQLICVLLNFNFQISYLYSDFNDDLQQMEYFLLFYHRVPYQTNCVFHLYFHHQVRAQSSFNNQYSNGFDIQGFSLCFTFISLNFPSRSLSPHAITSIICSSSQK